MKELGFTIKDFTGLRLVEDAPLNSKGLTVCRNLIARPQGLVGVPSISTHINTTVDYPFPQLFLGHVHWILCTRTKIYIVNGDWTLTLAFTVDAGSIWQFADYYDYAILTNGIATVVYDTVAGEWTLSDGVKVPTLTAICDFNGQILGAQENRLLWSAIGAADFIIDQSNVKGSRPMPWFGEIYAILKLGDGFAVYGSNGIAFMRFSGVTPGIVSTLGYGLLSGGAVAGGEGGNVFIDTEGNFRMVGPDFKVSEPLYKEFFQPMVGREIVITENPLRGDYYITDGVKSYIKSDQGLTETFQSITGLQMLGGVLYGVYSNLSIGGIELSSDVLDFGYRGRKALREIEVGGHGSGSSTIEVGCDVRWDYNSGFIESDWVEINSEGWAALNISGVEFRIKARSSDYSNVKIDYITARMQYEDRRGLRGTNANSVAA